MKLSSSLIVLSADIDVEQNPGRTRAKGRDPSTGVGAEKDGPAFVPSSTAEMTLILSPISQNFVGPFYINTGSF